MNRYSSSWWQLKKSQGWWTKEKVDNKRITQTIADICKFVTDDCVHIGGTFFNTNSELAMEEKYERLRNWRTMLDMTDYKLSDVFD